MDDMNEIWTLLDILHKVAPMGQQYAWIRDRVIARLNELKDAPPSTPPETEDNG